MCILLSHLLYGIYISHLLKWTQHTNKTQLHFTTLLMKPVLLLRLHICVRFLNMSFEYKILSAFLYTNHYFWYTIIYTYTIWFQLCNNPKKYKLDMQYCKNFKFSYALSHDEDGYGLVYWIIPRIYLCTFHFCICYPTNNLRPGYIL